MSSLQIYLPATIIALSGFACSKSKQATSPPIAAIAAVDEAPEPEPEPEPAPPTRRVGDDAIAVGTFNLQWAHDPLGDAPKLAKRYRAKSDEDWEWKVAQIAQLLADERLDVVALQELGGESEVTDIALAVERLGGPSYDWAFLESTDRLAGHHVAILSRFPIESHQRFDIHMRRHLAADIALPDETTVTFVAMHAAGGKYPSNEQARAKQAKALKRALKSLQAEHPVILLGTMNSPHLPGAKKYRTSSAGVLSGRTTRREDDDCFDSAEFLTGQSTTVSGATADRIVSCGLEIADVELVGHDAIVRDEADPNGRVWSEIPIEEAPYRDVSDHLVLWAEITLPPPPEPPETAGDATASP
ncbi:MAG: endonuclease/exonuclease/phosphatase family protein [Nannocystaceae bacterium]|nr:endonuclease/exonuclease/phosphatase family protein [Nannocystaceae bacterium]